MILAKDWNGKALEGVWIVSLKIDGVRARLTPEGAFSRNNKKLYGCDGVLPTTGEMDVEIYCGSFKKTIEILRNHSSTTEITHDHIYSLNPLDPELFERYLNDPTPEIIKRVLQNAVEAGYEGLVLRQGDTWVKVKKEKTFDVKVTGIIEGKGQFIGMLGAFMTPMGKVGTGFTKDQRTKFYSPDMVGETIEVECMELTLEGKFRHPRFVRVRFDK